MRLRSCVAMQFMGSCMVAECCCIPLMLIASCLFWSVIVLLAALMNALCASRNSAPNTATSAVGCLSMMSLSFTT